jgi:hypothetical protein
MDGNRMSIDTSGFYKLDGDEVLFAPNFVHGPFEAYSLTRADRLTYTYPVDGWYWFDTIALAYEFFALNPVQDFSLACAATINASVIKNGPGQLLTMNVSNTAAVKIYLKMYNKATVPNPAVLMCQY